MGRRIRDRISDNGRQSFSTYEAALQACRGFGYKNETLAAIVCRKTEIYRDQLASGQRPNLAAGDLLSFFVLSSALRNSKQPLHVIDFGGACGYHYFTVKAYLGDAVSLRWCVVETETMATQGKKLENDELAFCTSVDAAKQKLTNVDIAHTSCALHYVPDLYTSLRQLVAVAPRFLILARFGVKESEGEEFSVQESWLNMHGPGPLPAEFADAKVKYPAFYLSRKKLESTLKSKFNLFARCDDPAIDLTINSQPIVGCGYAWQAQQS